MCGLAAPSTTSLERERGYGGVAAPRGEAGQSDRDEEHQQLSRMGWRDENAFTKAPPKRQTPAVVPCFHL